MSTCYNIEKIAELFKKVTGEKEHMDEYRQWLIVIMIRKASIYESVEI